jgi:hypothetical protein
MFSERGSVSQRSVGHGFDILDFTSHHFFSPAQAGTIHFAIPALAGRYS